MEGVAMILKYACFALFGTMLIACSDRTAGAGDYEGSDYLLGEILNKSDYDAELKFFWQYDGKEDSAKVKIAKGDTVRLYDSSILIQTFIENFELAYPNGTYNVSIEFKSSPSKCLSFAGDVDKNSRDIRSEKYSEVIDSSVNDGTIFKRYIIDSALYKKSRETNCK